MIPAYDKNSPGNTQYRTGKPCRVRGCDKPAGTVWDAELCVEHNMARLKKIEKGKP